MPNALRKPRQAPARGSSDERVEAVRAAVASARIEGVAITSQTQAVFDEYATGALESDEMMEQVLRMYGPGA